jgi:hypothetical protein
MRQKPQYRYLSKFIDTHGTPRLYFRRKGYPRIALPGPIASPEFILAYTAALEEPAILPSTLPGGVVAKRGQDPNTVQPLIGV